MNSCFTSLTRRKPYLLFAMIVINLILYNLENFNSKPQPTSTIKEPTVDKFVSLQNQEELHPVKAFKRGIRIEDKYSILRNETEVRFEVCKTFEFSPVDWTLYELRSYDKNLESEICQQLYKEIFEAIDLPYQESAKVSIRRQKRVKWIVHPNGTITNLGCTKHTHQCEPGSFFDKQRNIRIDTPPCCREHLMKQLDLVSMELNKKNVSYTVAGGYVISYARRKEILHYDDDIDLFIGAKYWDNESFVNFFNELSRKYSFVQQWTNHNTSMSLLVSKKNENGLGMWRYYRDKRNPDEIRAVSYTHLTLPTICSV